FDRFPFAGDELGKEIGSCLRRDLIFYELNCHCSIRPPFSIKMVADRPADRIYAFTKFVAALLGAVVFFAFCVLYFFSTRTKQLFAWPIAPPMTAMFIGASYANGVIFFASVLAGKKWNRIWAPHVGVFVFESLLLVATFLHWDKFTHNHPVFW